MAERFSTALRNEVLKASGSSYADALADGIIYLYTGTQPATADATEGTATNLVKITLASGAFTSGVSTNGINLAVAASGVLSKAVAETWSGTNLADGVIGWGRFYANTVVQGVVTTTGVRMDFAVSQSGAELDAGNTTVVTGGTTTISTFTITLPAG